MIPHWQSVKLLIGISVHKSYCSVRCCRKFSFFLSNPVVNSVFKVNGHVTGRHQSDGQVCLISVKEMVMDRKLQAGGGDVHVEYTSHSTGIV